MNVVLWIIAAVLAVAFLAAGLLKVSQPKEKLAATGLKWTEDFTAGQIKAIAILEILAAVGLILPPALHIAPVLAPLAALGLAIVMVGAIVVHGRRREFPNVVFNAILLVLAVIVVWGRFGPYSF